MLSGPGTIVVHDTPEALSRDAAARIVAAARATVETRGSFTLALAGGGTPLAAYRLLAGAVEMPWAVTQLYWGDERCVPPDDAESNYGAARRALLDHLTVPPAQVHRIEGEDPDPHAAAARYAALLPARFDLLLLGIGEDGHIASLFPGDIALHEHTRRAVAVLAPKPPPRRITITPPVLAAARATLVLATGAAKASPVVRALVGDINIDELPAQLVRPATWLLDRGAARELARVLPL